MLDPLVVRPVGRVGRPRPPQQRTDARAELADRERLRDVVVGAELEPDHLVELVVAGSEHDDRHGALGPQALADLEPIEAREHDVEHDEIDRLGVELLERLLAVAGLDDLVAVAFEREREHRTHRVLVVDEQDRGRRVGHRLETPAGARETDRLGRPRSYYSPAHETD